eukprot:TRINITY_DN6_c0_g2_i1.p1 TRINITY_DN6_c0_g2~~TRINITY_DN6_c0_g2_i1.p1  ORF type:complete len:530 (+),score=184.50 TRINITY_DN6_c0_g2_i1:110-1699(+)
MMKVLFVLALLVALVFTQTSTLDPFDGISSKLEVPGTSAETQSESTVQSNIIGGERDMILRGTGEGSSSNCESETFVENGSWFANNGQTCSADAILQFDGVDGSPNLALGLGTNLNNVGVAFLVDIQTDLATSFTITLYSSQSSSSTVTQPIQASNEKITYTFSFASFTGTADLTQIGAIELQINAEINTDVIVTLFDIISDEASGRVFSDCNCNGIQDTEDNGLSGVVVTGTPGAGCSNTALTKTATTDVNGNWLIESLEACSYTFNAPGTCSSSPSVTIDVSNSPQNINFGIEQAGSLTVPADQSINCNESTDPSNTGSASCSTGACSGSSGTATFTDSIVSGNCDSNFSIVRAWTCGAETLNQQITVSSTGINPTLNVPGSVTLNCGESTDPSNTGSATGTGECNVGVNVSFDDSETRSCDRNSCSFATTISRVWTGVDDCGLSATGSQTIIVNACEDGSVPDCPTFSVNDEDEDDDCPDVGDGDVDDDFCACPSDDEDDGNDSSSSDAQIAFLSVFAVLFAFLFY